MTISEFIKQSETVGGVGKNSWQLGNATTYVGTAFYQIWN